MTILGHIFQVGGPGSGKSSNVSLLAGLVGRPLRVLPVNSAMDTTEILGGFEQVGNVFIPNFRVYTFGTYMLEQNKVNRQYISWEAVASIVVVPFQMS
jgi:midasin (ATPase involved in ribosome maturation)